VIHQSISKRIGALCDAMGTSGVEDRAHPTAPQSTPAEQSSPASLRRETACSTLTSAALAAHCLRELSNYRQGELCDEMYGLELFRRATVLGDPEAWLWVQHCFSDMVRGWLRCHPHREATCRLDSEENYVAQAFERFWQATTATQRVEFSRLAAALQYLRASLHGAILDTLRTYSRPRDIPLPEPGVPGEPYTGDQTDSSEVWEILKRILPNERQQRLAYLLYHCGLKPREIVRFCPQEWSEVQEIYRLRRNILERLLRHANQLRWRLTPGEEGQ
jgi:hypothetical protein